MPKQNPGKDTSWTEAPPTLYNIDPQANGALEVMPALPAPNPLVTKAARAQSVMQRALARIGVTPAWLADRAKENALAFKPVTYCGEVTRWVPDIPTRVKAIDQLLRLAGHYQEAERSGASVAVELTIDERRQIQVKAAARLASWGRPYTEETDELADE